MDSKVEETITKVFNDNQKGGKVLAYQMTNYFKLVNKKLEPDEEELEEKMAEMDPGETGAYDLETFKKLVAHFLAKM